MNKRKSIVISIVIVILIIVLVAGGTSAYLVAITNEQQVDTGSGMLGINYSPPDSDALTGVLNASSDRNRGLHAVAKASLESSSEAALFNMYVTPTTLSDNLKIEAFKWEVVVDGTVIKHGDFSKASVSTPIKVVDSYALTTDDTEFNIYIWLDASMLTSAISGAGFAAKITADTVQITGEF